MDSSQLPCTKKPCADCPFRKDSLKGWLGKKRIEEILEQDSFVCHKNNDLQCSGHMLLKEEENSFYKLATRMFVDFSLKGRELVFDTKEECIEHHSTPIKENKDK